MRGGVTFGTGITGDEIYGIPVPGGWPYRGRSERRVPEVEARLSALKNCRLAR